MARKHRTSCSVAGCEKPASRVGAGLCEMHYMRVRRHGDTDKVNRVKSGLLEHTGGYLLAYAPDHPLSRNRGRVYEHRAVFYAEKGEGPFRCHWCARVVTWDDMHVDHLNDDVKDNRPGNLVASCPRCNQRRGLWKMAKVHRESSGRRYSAHGKTMCLSEWSRETGVTRAALEFRLRAGWPSEKVFGPRVGRSGPPSKPRR
jgi:hypothetical protein